jgi:hypothetical protein
MPEPYSEDVQHHYGALKAACERVNSNLMIARENLPYIHSQAAA